MMLLWRAKNKVITIMVVLTVIAFLNPGFARAEDCEDLLNMYGLTLGTEEKIITEQDKDALELRKIAIMDQVEVDRFNSFVESANIKNTEAVSAINSQVSKILSENNKLAKEIEDGIVSLSMKDLIVKNNSYKSNIEAMDSMLKNIDYYNMYYNKKEYSYDLEEIEKSINVEKVIYVKPSGLFELGDVHDLKWIMPNKYTITSRYGTRIDPILKTKTQFHSGTDYRCSVGTEVGSLFNGVVQSCGWSDTIGYFIVIQSGENVKTMICHLSRILVKTGQKVNQYETVALTGGTGSRSTAPHLHLALYLNGNTYDVSRLFRHLEYE